MSEEERAGQQQRYCRTCGAEVRPGSAFCISCGTRLIPGPEGEGTPHPAPPPGGWSMPFADTIHESLQGASGWLRAASTGLDKGALLRLPERAVRWFKDLPSTPKLVIAGVLLLALFTVLSPLALVAAVLVFGVSVVALIVRVAQRGSVVRWGLVAAASLVLIFAFAGISSALYGEVMASGGSESNGGDSGNGDVSDAGYEAGGNPPSPAGVKIRYEMNSTVPVPSESGEPGRILLISATAESLGEEDIRDIADYFAARKSDHDAVKMSVDLSLSGMRSRMPSGMQSEQYGGCSGSEIEIALTNTGSLITGVDEGSYSYSCE